MNIYCELLLDKIRIKIDGEELAFQVTNGFYDNKMSKDFMVGTRIKGYVYYHKTGLSLLEKLQNSISGNKVYALVDQDVQERVTMRNIHDFASRFLDARPVFIIPKPSSFDSTQLENMTKIRTEYIDARQHGDAAMASVARVMSTSGR